MKNIKQLLSSARDAAAALFPFLVASAAASALIGLLSFGMVSCAALAGADGAVDPAAIGDAAGGVATAVTGNPAIGIAVGTLVGGAATWFYGKRKQKAS